MSDSYYVCPKCGSYSGNMRLLEERYEPTENEVRVYPSLQGIEAEILLCRCGKKNTWFMLRKQTFDEPLVKETKCLI